MASTGLIKLLFMVMFIGTIMSTEGRYLPTRTTTDHLDRLSDLLRDILELDPETNVDNRQGNDNSYDPDSMYDRGGLHYPKQQRVIYKYRN